MPQEPVIVGFVGNLMSMAPIESAAERLGFHVEWIENIAGLGGMDEGSMGEIETVPRQYAEHLVGPGAILIERLTTWHPALIVVELDNSGIQMKKWIALIKSAPATRRIPLICFGSHKDTESIQAAMSAGADAVFARSRFFTDLPHLITEYARSPDLSALDQTCQTPLSDLAIRGLELFNRGDFFESHELLEEAWNEDPTPGRELYRAILQVAVAYLQIKRRNYKGAVKMFWRVRQWIDPLPDECRGVNVAQLREDAGKVYDLLIVYGEQRIGEIDHRLLKPVNYSVL